jgi:hypothetical protein
MKNFISILNHSTITIILLTNTLLTINLFSQSFKCIIDNSIHYFENEGEIKTIQIDSVINEGDNLVYYNYPTLQAGPEQWCYALDGPSWIGRKIIEKPDGDFIFFNLENEPITIKSQAEVSENWVCYEFENGDYIEATIESVIETEFLDISDLAKKIVLLAYNANGELIEHTINNRYLLLSENYGLIRLLNFKLFPDLFDEVWDDQIKIFNIVGIEGNESGVENLTWDKIFNLEIGDEYHTERFVNSWPLGEVIREYFINVIIDKEIFFDGDSLVYQLSRCGQKKVIDNYGNVDYTFFNDTTNKIYSKNNFNICFLDTLAERIITTGDEAFHEYFYSIQLRDSYGNKSRKLFMEGLYSEPPHECIWQIVTGNKSPGLSSGYYVEGLGGPYWSNYEWWEDVYKIVYYNTQGEEWGEPLICDSLLIGIEKKYAQKKEVNLYPNPATDFIAISSTYSISEVSFYNLKGERIFNVNFLKNTIDISGLKPGLYFAEIKTSEGEVMRKIVVQ